MLQFKVFIFCMLIASSCWAQSLEQQAKYIQVNYGVKIYYNSDDSQIFTKKYLRGPYYGTCGKITKSKAYHALRTIKKFFKAYPKELIKKNLKKIALCRDLGFYNLEHYYTGAVLRDEKMIFVEYYAIPNEMDDTLHHEFSSILLHKYMYLFPRREWYKNSGRYTKSLYKTINEDPWKSTVALRNAGFLHFISKNNFEDDFNILASGYFVEQKKMYRMIRGHSRLEAKYKIIKSFYKKIFDIER
tara:strand:- start:46 stop:777 length:732 start_codon:yes stop_codon:yes gene_type:complete